MDQVVGEEVVAEGLEEDADEDGEGGGLGGDGEVSGDGGGAAGVDVGHPHLEGGDGGLEAEADDQEGAGEDQGLELAVAGAGNEAGDLAEVGAAAEAEQHRHAVEQHGGGDRAQEQVLEPRLGAQAVLVEADEDVLGQAGQLQGDEDADQVAGAGQEHQAGGAEEDQGEVLAAARGDALHRLPGSGDGGERRAGDEELEEEGELVEDEDAVEGFATDLAVDEEDGAVGDGAEDGAAGDERERAALLEEEVGDEQETGHDHEDQLGAEEVDFAEHQRPPPAATSDRATATPDSAAALATASPSAMGSTAVSKRSMTRAG